MTKKLAKTALVLIAVGTVLMLASPAYAQGGATGGGFFQGKSAANFCGPLGAGLVVMGGAAGIGRVGGSAVESMARQPEATGNISTAMIITAAMIEGATLFGVLGCFLASIA